MRDPSAIALDVHDHACPSRSGSTVPPMSEPLNGNYFKLSSCDAGDIAPVVLPLLVESESVVAAFKGTRDYVVFTTKRVLVVDVRGLSGKRRAFTSLPYRNVQAFSVEVAGAFDVEAQLDIWFSRFGKVRFDFKGEADLRQVAQLIAQSIL